MGVLLFAVLCAALSTALAQEPAVFRSDTRLVEVDAVVRDKNGPVKGLTRDDFTLDDCNPQQRDLDHPYSPCKGKRQPIAVFREVDGASAPTALPLPPGAVSNRMRGGEAVTSSTVVLLDQLNTPFDLKGYERLRVAELVKSVGDENRIALYSMGLKLQILQDFTDDPKKLMDAVAKLDSGDQVNFAQDLDASGNPITTALSAGEAMAQADMKNPITLDAIKVIIKHMQGAPGRKNLVWIAQNFGILNPRFGPPTARFLLGQANIAVYQVCVRCVPGGPPRVGDNLGGAWFPDAGYALDAVRAAEEDSNSYYVLGFYPAQADLDEKTHQLTLDVSGKALSDKRVVKSTLELQYKQVYLATKSGSAKAEPKTAIADIFHSPLDASAIGLTAMIGPDPTKPGARRVEVIVDLADVQLERQGDRWVGSLQVAMRLEANDKNVRMVTPPAPRTVPIRLTDAEIQAKRTSGFRIALVLTGDPKPGWVHVVVQDWANGAAGSVRVPIASGK
jgi:VWFA-related protein